MQVLSRDGRMDIQKKDGNIRVETRVSEMKNI